MILDISYKFDCLDKREFTSSEYKGYMGIPDKGLTTSMDLGTKRSNKKKKLRFPLLTLLNRFPERFSKVLRVHLI